MVRQKIVAKTYPSMLALVADCCDTKGLMSRFTNEETKSITYSVSRLGYTWAMLAEAMGCSLKLSKMASMGSPKQSSICLRVW